MAADGQKFGRLDGKIALITGASSGIGTGTAKLFSQLGAKLALTGRKEENLKKTAEECKALGDCQAVYVVGDITIEEDVKRIVDETIKQFGKLDILVNNAGIIETGSIETTSLEQFDRMMNINVRSVYHLTMLAVPYLTQTKGCIVNVSSVTGLRSVSFTSVQDHKIPIPSNRKHLKMSNAALKIGFLYVRY